MSKKKTAAKKTTAKKTAAKKTVSPEASYNATLLNIQKLANNSAKTIQELVNKSNTETMNFNRQEAKTAREWEQGMSNTAHRREVRDLKKAGLNPVLSVNNGAQSYTTSSASTNNDSGASATSAILEGQIGAMTNLESARMSTQAQLQAAKQQAEAMKYAARQSAAAQRYASQQAAAASRYHSDRALEAQKYKSDTDKWIATNKQPSGLFGFIDKQLEQTGGNKLIKKIAKPFMKKFEKCVKDPFKFFKKTGKTITIKNFKLNKDGQKMFDALNRKAGISPTVANRRLAVQAFIFQNPSSMRKYNIIVQNARKTPATVKPHHGAATTTRHGHR